MEENLLHRKERNLYHAFMIDRADIYTALSVGPRPTEQSNQNFHLPKSREAEYMDDRRERNVVTGLAGMTKERIIQTAKRKLPKIALSDAPLG